MCLYKTIYKWSSKYNITKNTPIKITKIMAFSSLKFGAAVRKYSRLRWGKTVQAAFVQAVHIRSLKQDHAATMPFE